MRQHHPATVPGMRDNTLFWCHTIIEWLTLFFPSYHCSSKDRYLKRKERWKKYAISPFSPTLLPEPNPKLMYRFRWRIKKRMRRGIQTWLSDIWSVTAAISFTVAWLQSNCIVIQPNIFRWKYSFIHFFSPPPLLFFAPSPSNFCWIKYGKCDRLT